MLRRRGSLEATAGVAVHIIHHLTSLASLCAGAGDPSGSERSRRAAVNRSHRPGRHDRGAGAERWRAQGTGPSAAWLMLATLARGGYHDRRIPGARRRDPGRVGARGPRRARRRGWVRRSDRGGHGAGAVPGPGHDRDPDHRAAVRGRRVAGTSLPGTADIGSPAGDRRRGRARAARASVPGRGPFRSARRQHGQRPRVPPRLGPRPGDRTAAVPVLQLRLSARRRGARGLPDAAWDR